MTGRKGNAWERHGTLDRRTTRVAVPTEEKEVAGDGKGFGQGVLGKEGAPPQECHPTRKAQTAFSQQQ